MKDSIDDYRTDYIGPEYIVTPHVSTFHSITRFGRSSDITDLLSSDQDAQASYAAGLIALVTCSLAFFAFWAVALMTFKCMGENAGFLSGRPFLVRFYERSKCVNRRMQVRWLFVVATIFLWVSAVLLLGKGVTELDGTTNAADNSLVTLRSKIEAAEVITESIQQVGAESVKIRDKVVYLFDRVICDNINIEDTLGVSLGDLKEQARNDLNELSNFLYDSLDALLSGIATVNKLTTSAESLVSEARLGGWPALIISGLLFILPAFFVVGVGCAAKHIRARRYELYLSYVVLPMFMGIVAFCVCACCVLIPLAAMNADFCIGSSSSGGPDDTILIAYRNLLGNDQSARFHVVAYYTQRCFPDYYPYGFLSTYFDKLGTAKTSIDELISVLGGNLDIIQNRCGTNDGEQFLSLAKSMQSSLLLLSETVDDTLSLVNCEDINKMYVNAVHTATCTNAPAAMGWIYGTLLAISISGMIMITFRSAYLSTQPDKTFIDIKSSTNDIKTSSDRAHESVVRLQKLYRDRQIKDTTIDRMHEEEGAFPSFTSHKDDLSGENSTVDNAYVMPSAYAVTSATHRQELGFVVIPPDGQDDVSAFSSVN